MPFRDIWSWRRQDVVLEQTPPTSTINNNCTFIRFADHTRGTLQNDNNNNKALDSASSWYGSISSTTPETTTSASSSLTSSPYDSNKVAKRASLLKVSASSTTTTNRTIMEHSVSLQYSTVDNGVRQPLLGRATGGSHSATDGATAMDPLHNHDNDNHNLAIHNINSTTTCNNKDIIKQESGPPSLCWGAVANLCSATLGAGLLALPFAFANAGWIGGLILLTGSAMATQYSITMIVMAAGAAKVAVRKARAAAAPGNAPTTTYRSDSYESLVEYLLGKPWRRLVEVCLVVFCFGCIIGYIITVGDLLETAHLTRGDHRVLSMVIVWCLAMLPLSLLRRMQSLQWASAVGIASIGTLVVASLINLIEDANHGSNHTPTGNTTTNTTMMMMWNLAKKSGTGSKVNVEANLFQCLWPKGWIAFVRALPLILFAFSCQVNVCAIYDELPTAQQQQQQDGNNKSSNTTTTTNTAERTPEEIDQYDESLMHASNGEWPKVDSSNTVELPPLSGTNESTLINDRCVQHHPEFEKRIQEEQVVMFQRVSRAAVAICAFLYASIALIGLANFGRHVFPNIVSNYQVPINAVMQAAFAGTALAVIMAFPLNVFPVRITLRGLLCKSPPRPTNVNDGGPNQSNEQQPASTTTTTTTAGNNLSQPLLHQRELPSLSLDPLENPELIGETRIAVVDIITESQLPLGDDKEQQDEEDHDNKTSLVAHFLLTFMIAGSALGVALVLPNISVVFGLLGGSTTSILGFVVPGFLGLAAINIRNDEIECQDMTTTNRSHVRPSIQRWQCWVLVVGGAVIGVVTTIVTIYSYTSK